jgi:cobalt-zinc-cadmium efflux system membrane fusion protein
MIYRTVLSLMFLTASAAAAPLTVSPEERELLGIAVEPVALMSDAGTGSLTMRVAFSPDGEWAIKTPLPGILNRTFVQEGDRVQAGDPLVIVRSPEFVELQRDFLKARAEARLTEAAWKRDQKLNEAGSVSERRWQETRYQYEMAQAEYAGFKGQLLLAGYSEKDLGQLTGNSDISPDMVLRAPATAIVLERPAMLGDQLDGSELLVRLGEPDKLVLEAILAKSAAFSLREGARIRLVDGNSQAVIVFISSVLDPVSQTVRVRAMPDDPAGLSAGQLTSWRILSDQPVLLVPSAAVVKLDGEDVVYLEVPGGFEPRQVEVRSTTGGAWVVLNGLGPQDHVAVTGTAVLKGMSMGMGGGEG